MSKFSEAIIDYCANKDNAPDKSVSKDRFEQEIGSAFDVLFNSWLQITKEMKVFILYANDLIFNKMASLLIVGVLSLVAVDCWFEPRSGQTKDYEIGICCFTAKHAALKRKSKDWLARNQDNVFEWATCLSADCCFSELALCIQLSMLV